MGNPQKSKGQNGTSIADIAEKIGETERTTVVIENLKDKMSSKKQWLILEKI